MDQELSYDLPPEYIRKFVKYWDDLPFSKRLDDLKFKKISKGKINLRQEILKVLADGVPIIHPDTGEATRLHVLAAADIKQQLEGKLEDTITASNVYFHLTKLEEYKLVKIVDQVETERRPRAYYGRVARTYMLDHDVTNPVISPFENTNFMDEVFHFMTKKNPDMDINEIDGLKDQMTTINVHRVTHDKFYTERYEQWFEDNKDLIRAQDLNLIETYFVFQEIINYQKAITQVMNKFSDLMGFSFPEPEFLENL